MRHLRLLQPLSYFSGLVLLLGSIGWCGPANAQTNKSSTLPITDKAATAQVAAQLVASVAAVTPGSEIYLGVHQQIIPHWHTYWLNPGDSGLATTIKWTLPEGASASEILWPIPSRSSLGGITNFGYSDQVTLLSKIRVPTNLQADSFTAQATVDWLVCNEECIPQQVKLALTLPITSSSPQDNSNPLIAQALSQLPVISPWPVRLINKDKKGYQLQIDLPEEQASHITSLWFFPAEWGRLAQNAEQPFTRTKDGISLHLPIGDAPLETGAALRGVLVVTVDTPEGPSTTGFELALTPAMGAAASDASNSAIGFLAALALALLGGLVLNLMPCVFPVLSLKALSLVGHAQHHPREVRLQGWVYTLGVLVSFGFLAGLLVALKSGGAQIGWGFQFQSPIFVLAMAFLMFAVGLNLSGVFLVGGSIAGVGSDLAAKPGYAGSFFTGVLATIVATPCTAPFMAAALGYALTQPAIKLIAIFLSLGFGLALPYLLLANWPGLQRWLPRPGVWMDYTKQALAFPMYAATAWLVWVLAQQAGADAVVLALSGLVALGFAAWLYQITRNRQRELLGTFAALAVILVTLSSGFVFLNGDDLSQQVASDNQKRERNYEPYSAQRLEELLAEGKPVFLNFTASWCISCLVNERVALSNARVVDAFKTEGITYLKGDWTKRDPQITQILSRFGRSGVPLYVYYPAGHKAPPVELPQVLTPDTVLSRIAPKEKTASTY